MTDPLPLRPFEEVGLDYLSVNGKDYLLYMDRLSSWPILFQFNRGQTTANKLIEVCRRCFIDYGAP